jgi:hypothetical protein
MRNGNSPGHVIGWPRHGEPREGGRPAALKSQPALHRAKHDSYPGGDVCAPGAIKIIIRFNIQNWITENKSRKNKVIRLLVASLKQAADLTHLKFENRFRPQGL